MIIVIQLSQPNFWNYTCEQKHLLVRIRNQWGGRDVRVPRWKTFRSRV